MPYQIRKVKGKKCYRLTNKKTKRVLAKCSTLKKIKNQLRFLNYINHTRKKI
jgi:hypothetical protein